MGLPTPLEPLNVPQTENMFRVNTLGVVYAIEAVLPESTWPALVDPTQIELVPHELPRTQISEAYRSLRYGDFRDAIAGLSFGSKATLYADYVLGAPQHVDPVPRDAALDLGHRQVVALHERQEGVLER